MLFQFDRWVNKRVALASILVIHIALSLICAHFRSLNLDEKTYFEYTVRCLKGHPERVRILDDSKTILVFPALIPRMISQIFHPGLTKNDGGIADILHGRYTILVYSVLLLLFLWLSLKKLDLPYAMLVFPLAAINPMIVNYATFINSDMAVGLFTLLLFYYGWQFFSTKKTRYLVYLSIVCGLGFVCKFSFIPVLMAFFIGGVFLFFTSFRSRSSLLFGIRSLAVVFVISVLVINLCYPTDKRFVSLRNMELKSEKFKALSQSFVGAFPLPVPQNMVQAADQLSYHSQPNLPIGDITFEGRVWLLGGLHTTPLWFYYWVLLGIKTPIFLLLLMIIGAAAAIFSYRKYPFIFLATVVALFYCAYSGYINFFQIGDRHLLAIYPLLFVVAGFAMYKLSEWLSIRQVVAFYCMGFIWLLISEGYYFPHFMPYTNEFITDKKTAHWTANVGVTDYCQSVDFAEDFIKNNPGYKKPFGDTSHNGKYAICVFRLFYDAYFGKDPKSLELWNRRPTRIERFVVLIFDEDK
ncbi:glycosyltransferase family 39 protein [Pinibacter aurantiacus]|uniref:Glycosyltransferase family 39 protein n=1 Tax=Pinibacter aurantiacus TaxID=2851599 RepID=A0A9E2SEG6_9BACT|nr:glycosyltransferase family 39 protein [Pinibacter aurantiacus]MBV4359893.1 glycosyltransferase family 39 protein [Pinibacter aurantiacus]